MKKKYPYPILFFFNYAHLPARLQGISAEFHALAWKMAQSRDQTDAETAAGLRKLLEAKDCFVRAGIEP